MDQDLVKLKPNLSPKKKEKEPLELKIVNITTRRDHFDEANEYKNKKFKKMFNKENVYIYNKND